MTYQQTILRILSAWLLTAIIVFFSNQPQATITAQWMFGTWGFMAGFYIIAVIFGD